MEKALLDVLRESVRTRLRNEEIERSVGRTVRRRELDFKTYIQVISALREFANENEISIDDAATRLLSEQDQRDEKHDG